MPRLWSIKDPVRLINLEQFELPGFGVASLKTAEQL
jgi:hypothetical protein